MHNNEFWEYVFLFLSASLASVFKYFNEKQKDVTLLVTQLLFGCFIAFIAIPYLSESVEMSYKGSLFFTWVLTYFSNSTLNAFFKIAFAKVDPDQINNAPKTENENEGN